MVQINAVEVPEGRLISPFAVAEGHHTDAFTTEVAGPVSLTDLIMAFYTTPLFKAERLVLRFLARSPSTDDEVRAFADGDSDRFAVWQTEGRTDADILLRAADGRTKSWLAVEPCRAGTRLWFGSVVVPVMRKGKLTKGPVFDSLLGAHLVYSRALLAAASTNLRRMGRLETPA